MQCYTQTPSVTKLPRLTTLSCSLRCLLAEHCSTVRTTKRTRHNPESISQEAIYHGILARTFSRYQIFENTLKIEQRCFSKVIWIRLLQRSAVPLLVNGGDLDALCHRLLYKWTMHGKSPSITTGPNTVQN